MANEDVKIIFCSDICRVFPIGQWTHVVLTWNEEEGPQIHVNGSVVGNFSERIASANSSTFSPKVFIGSGFERRVVERGAFNRIIYSFSILYRPVKNEEKFRFLSRAAVCLPLKIEALHNPFQS